MMKISEIYRNRKDKETVFSFEFFPPKDVQGEERLYQSVQELQTLHPSFVTVTYGAGGSTRNKTIDWVTNIQNSTRIPTMAHYTCVGAGRLQIENDINELYGSGIRNIMALRGDPPKGEVKFTPAADGFANAWELVTFIKKIKPDISIGAACYPEKHAEARTLDEDIRFLKQKADAGADVLITQLFFENKSYFDFIKRVRVAGIHQPVVPGIMPITQLSQIERFTKMAGCTVPEDLILLVNRHADDKERLLNESIRWSANQCRALIDGGAPGIHFYTLNQSRATRDILEIIRG